MRQDPNVYFNDFLDMRRNSFAACLVFDRFADPQC